MVGLAMAVGVGAVVGMSNLVRGTIKTEAASGDNFDLELYKGKGTSGSGSSMSAVQDNITVTFSKGYYSSSTDVRNYASGTITFAADTTYIESIDSVTMTATESSKSGGNWSVSSGGGTVSKDGTTISWSGTSTGFVLANSAQLRCSSLIIEYTSKTLSKSIVITGLTSSGLYLKGDSYDVGYEVLGFDNVPTITDVTWTVSSGGGSIADGQWTTGPTASSKANDVTIDLSLRADGTLYNAPQVTVTIDEVTAFKKNSPKTKFTTDEVFTVGHTFDVEYTYASAGTVAETDAGISYRLENSTGTKLKDITYNSTKFTTDDSGKYIDATYKGVDLTTRYSITVIEVFDNTIGAYYLVTDESELSDGDHVTLFGYYSKSGTTNSFVPTSFATKNIVSHTVSLDNNAIDGDQEFRVLDFVLEDTSKDLAGSFAFSVANDATNLGKYLYAAHAGENQLKVQGSIDQNARFVITINDSTNVASIVATGSTNRNKMGANYNSGSQIMACYSTLPDNNSLYLYKWVSNADKVQEFIDDNMKMNQYVGDNTYDKERCDANYAAAKEAFNGLTASQRELFVDEGGEGETYEAAYNRLVAWAAANGESLNGSNQLAKSAYVKLEFDVSSNSNSIPFIILATSMATIALVGGFFFLRKKKEK